VRAPIAEPQEVRALLQPIGQNDQFVLLRDPFAAQPARGRLERHRVGLQTCEWVLPSKDTRDSDWITAANRQAHLDDEGNADWTNRLIYGDNLLAMAALLAGDEHTPSLRGMVDLIYIDPPFDSKADYRTKVTLPGIELEQKPTVIEQFAYSNTWSDGTASYLAMIVPRLIVMRELLSDRGSLCVHIGMQVSHYVKIVADEIFGKNNFNTEVTWSYGTPSGGRAAGNKIVKAHEYLLWYTKNYGEHIYHKEYLPYLEKYLADRFTEVDAALARGDQPGRGQPQEAARGDERRAAGADRILGGGPRLRRGGVPLGVVGLPRQHRQRRRPAARGHRGAFQRAVQGRRAARLRTRG